MTLGPRVDAGGSDDDDDDKWRALALGGGPGYLWKALPHLPEGLGYFRSVPNAYPL